MLFLKLLFFASTFYVTFARPEDSCNDTEATEPPQTEQDYEQTPQDFINAILSEVDKYLANILSELDSSKQEEFKELAVNLITSSVNYWMLMAQDSICQGSLSPNDKNSWDNNNVDVEFQSKDQWDSPYISEIVRR